MWADTETTDDLLNFSKIAQTAAQLIKDSGSSPLSIGVSGNWGAGKSSLVKMIGKQLEREPEGNFVFLEFNAWLYQGYEDARMALLQSVADCLLKEAQNRESGLDKAKKFAQSIKWLNLVKSLAPAATGAILGASIGGPVGAVMGAASGLIGKGENATEEDYEKVMKACSNLDPILGQKHNTSLPQEIDKLRKSFEDLLAEMKINLVVLVDDLDRCLPDTTISTLEAMRLLLMMKRTAFVIAADEEMIRHAVRHHFGGVEIGDDLVTSYFDKLIQIPLRVPRLGRAEVAGFLILLFADQEKREGNLTESEYLTAKTTILQEVNQSWGSGLTRQVMSKSFGKKSGEMASFIGLADQIASILTTASQIAGNPRMIKRFLNDLYIRKAVAEAEGLTLAYEALLKLQLFERCAPGAAFEFLINQASLNENGQPPFLREAEDLLSKGEEYEDPDSSWDNPFIKSWMTLSPELGSMDLRPILNLSRSQVSSSVSYDKLGSKAQELYEALLKVDRIEKLFIPELKSLGEQESEQILVRLIRKARSEQISNPSILRAMNVIEAHPNLSKNVVGLLGEIPPKARKTSLIARVARKSWAAPLFAEWLADDKTPEKVRAAIEKY